MKPARVRLPAGGQSAAMPEAPHPAARTAASCRALGCPPTAAGHIAAALAEKGASPRVPTFGFCTSAEQVTSSGYIQCHSWQKCQTTAEGCREGSGLVDISSGELSTGSDWLVLIQCAVGSQWTSVKVSDFYNLT